jgi:hypothetical protein
LKKTLLRTIQYRFEDGIIELVMATMFLLAGIYFYLLAVIENNQLAEILTASFAVIYIGGWYLMQFLFRSLKERITFSRTGYVAYRKGQEKRAVRTTEAIVIAVLMGGLLAFAQIKMPQGWNLMPAFFDFLIAIVLGLMGLQSGLPRFYMLAVISLILGGTFASIDLNNGLATATYCGAMGVVLLISGSVILRQYLRQNSAQAESIIDK